MKVWRKRMNVVAQNWMCAIGTHILRMGRRLGVFNDPS